jgi:hypothetical protein
MLTRLGHRLVSASAASPLVNDPTVPGGGVRGAGQRPDGFVFLMFVALLDGRGAEVKNLHGQRLVVRLHDVQDRHVIAVAFAACPDASSLTDARKK